MAKDSFLLASSRNFLYVPPTHLSPSKECRIWLSIVIPQLRKMITTSQLNRDVFRNPSFTISYLGPVQSFFSQNHPGLFRIKNLGHRGMQRSVEPGSSTTLCLVKTKPMVADHSYSTLDKNNVVRSEPAKAWELSQRPFPCATHRTLSSALESFEVLGESDSKPSFQRPMRYSEWGGGE